MNNWQPDVKFEEGVFKFDLPNGDEFVIVPPQTKPLSDEKMYEVINKHWHREYGKRNMLTLCRAIEKEHGIK